MKSKKLKIIKVMTCDLETALAKQKKFKDKLNPKKTGGNK